MGNSQYGGSRTVYKNDSGTTDTFGGFVQQKSSMLQNNQIENNYHNMAKLSQYSQASQYVSFNYRPPKPSTISTI